MAQLLPPSVQGLYAGESPALHRYVTLVRESPDHTEIERQLRQQSQLAAAPSHRGLMTALLLNGHADGIYYSKRTEKIATERVDCPRSNRYFGENEVGAEACRICAASTHQRFPQATSAGSGEATSFRF